MSAPAQPQSEAAGASAQRVNALPAAMEPVAEPAPEPEPEPIEPLCADVQTWVEHVYVPTFTRSITQSQRWCPQWWRHPEAIVRLTALWQTWETARAADNPHAMADWLRLYLDGINPVLLADDGPFMSCREGEHNDPQLYQLIAAPADYWRDLSA